ELTSKEVDEPAESTIEIRKTWITPEIAAQSASGNTMLAFSKINSPEQKTATELAGNIQTDNSDALKPLKIVSKLINRNDQSDQILQTKKVVNTSNEQEELSIDQQIMNQNKQMMLAQNESQKKRRWLVGAQVSPTYSVSRSSHSNEYAASMISSSSANPVDLGGGVSVEFKKGKRWSLQSGVYYSGIGQSSGQSSSSSNSKNSFAADQGSKYFNTPVNIGAGTNKMSMNSTAGVIELNKIPSGMILGTSLEANTTVNAVILSNTSFIQSFGYLEIPLYLRYTLIDSRFDIEMLGGFSSNLLVGNQIFVEGSSGKALVGKTNDMQAVNYSGTLGIGLKYGLSKRIFLNVEPRLKYFLNSLNSNSSVTYKPYTIGVFTGLSYQF
ncbi:MAG TPA: outer membrane beta-barrel protein, partial [Prolixibacteraceae bacterium]